jgi:4-amino-4-deoxy-L-arabinose transferase-like glycosyltransferase
MELRLSSSWIRFAPLWLALAGLLLFLPGNNLAPLIDRDEPRFAQATREMIQRHEWVVPYFNDQYRFDKPVLIYWMMRPCYALFGANEFSARLPSVLSAIVLGWLVFRMGQRWFTARVGFFAAFGLLTCLQLLMHARSAVADMPMVAMVVLAQFAVWELIHDTNEKYPWRWFWLFYSALGVGFLAKGPVTIVVPLLTLLIFRFALWRKPIRWSRLKLGPGLLVTLVIMGAWGIPALLKTGGEFWTVGMKSHVYERGLSTFNGHAAFFLYYIVLSLVSLFPWIAFAGEGAVYLRHNWTEKNAFLTSWFLGTYILFSFYMTKLPHYVMPAFPAFFLILAQAAETDFPWPRWTRVFFRVVISILSLVAFVGLVGAFLIPFAPSYASLRFAMIGGAAVVLTLAWLAVLWRSGRTRQLVLPLILIAIGAVLLGSGLRAATPAVRLRPVFEKMPAGAEFGFYRFKEPSLVFYSNRKWQNLSNVDNVNAFLAKSGPRLVVAEEREVKLEKYLRWLVARNTPWEARDYSAEIAAIDTNGLNAISLEGINIARTCGVKLRVMWKM